MYSWMYNHEEYRNKYTRCYKCQKTFNCNSFHFLKTVSQKSANSNFVKNFSKCFLKIIISAELYEMTKQDKIEKKQDYLR